MRPQLPGVTEAPRGRVAPRSGEFDEKVSSLTWRPLGRGHDPSRRRFVQGLTMGGAVAGLGLLRSADAWAVGADPAAMARRARTRAAGHRVRAGDRPVAGQLHRRAAPRHTRQRQRARTDPALARGQRGHPARDQPPGHADLDPLARHPAAVRHGRRARAGAFPASRRARPSPTASRCARAAPTGTTRTRGFQEQTGLYGPIVVEPAGAERYPSDRDYVVMLSDWTDEDPAAHLRHAQAAQRLLQLSPSRPRRTSSATCARWACSRRWPNGACGTACA